jgi:plasmid maintenance system antidote protein VapI
MTGELGMAKYEGVYPIAVHPGGVLLEMIHERGVTQVRLAVHLGTEVIRINAICRRRGGWCRGSALDAASYACC